MSWVVEGGFITVSDNFDMSILVHVINYSKT